ncbi:hypothetical protein B0O99DRAFT_742052 [Bisporella sp. PMI_857]|nr:hypothetical protein B0O99DRAFT_742052 [Bisporella sp. PMI_857]
MDKDHGPTYSVPDHDTGRRLPSSTRIGGRIQEILTAFAVMTLPMILFSGLLLGLIFRYRVVQNDFVSSNLAFDSDQHNANAIFVRLSASTLIVVSSWSSTIAPILVSFAVTLVSYPIARGILSSSKSHDVTQLPTPYQLSLMLRMLTSAAPSALWGWLKYCFGWKGRRESQCKPLKSLATMLILGILLSALVLATDTWLHFTTITVRFWQVVPALDAPTVGFGVYPNCTDILQPYSISCNLNNPASGMVLLQNDPVKVLSNVSDSMLVQIHTVGANHYAYMTRPKSVQLDSLDYTAKTYAIQSYCTPVTSQCINPENVAGVSTPYKCPFAFEGKVNTAVGAQNSVAMAYFTDSSGQDNSTSGENTNNPYYYAAMVLVNMRNPRTAGQSSDPEVVEGGHGGATIVGLFCNATTYDVEYSSVNGTITRFVTYPSNSSITNIVQGTQALTDVGKANLVQAASVAGLGQSAQDISDAFALSYSQTALAAASGAFEPRDALEMQSRNEILVARVPKAPLMALVIANLLLVLLGIILTIIALLVVQGETGEVQARLSIPAVMAAYLEGDRVRVPVKDVEDMFEERRGNGGPRIGLSKSQEGGWSFGIWRLS